MRRRLPIDRARDGSIRINLDDSARELLLRLAGELEAVDSADKTGDPRMRRLHPTAYHQDPEHDEEFQRLMFDELRASRAASLQQTRDALLSDTMTEDQLMGFMRTLNSLRLILGTQLDVAEGSDSEPLDDDPAAPFHYLYEYLGYLLECSVQALSS
jgi:hypothetical protein